MSIRLKLMLIHGLSSLILLVLFSAAIYYFSWTFRKKDFFDRLAYRVSLVEQYHFEQDHLSKENLSRIKKQFEQFLTDEAEYIIPLHKNDTLDSLATHFSSDFVHKLQSSATSVFFEQQTLQGAGQIFNLGNKKVAIIVTATDRDGWTKLRYLRSVLLIGSIIAIGLIMFTTWWSLGRALRPLEVLVAEIRSFRASNLKHRLSVLNPMDEFGELSSTFNQLLSRLEEAFVTQRHFISNTSHEIRNPLAAILGEVELALMQERKAPAYRLSLQTIGDHAERLNNLINQLLELSKTQADSGHIEMEELRVDALIEEQIESLTLSHPSATITMDFHLPEDPDALMVSGNSVLLNTLFQNILLNALKFSDYQPVAVTLEASQGEISILVTDKGIGISEEDQKLIFEPLYRTHAARCYPGFGLGMALVRRIAEVHQGKIVIRSQVGHGTQVQFSIPTLKKSTF